jgi:exocyst complex protein 7
MLTSADGSLEEAPPASLGQFPEDAAAELVRIADWLILNSKDDYMTVYARIRAHVLLKSLQQLKEQQRSASGGSLQGSYSPLPVSLMRQNSM